MKAGFNFFEPLSPIKYHLFEYTLAFVYALVPNHTAHFVILPIITPKISAINASAITDFNVVFKVITTIIKLVILITIAIVISVVSFLAPNIRFIAVVVVTITIITTTSTALIGFIHY